MCRSLGGVDVDALGVVKNERERLEVAIKRVENADRHLCDDSRTIVEAARKHLATLPQPMWWVSYHDPISGTRKQWGAAYARRDNAEMLALDALRADAYQVSIERGP